MEVSWELRYSIPPPMIGVIILSMAAGEIRSHRSRELKKTQEEIQEGRQRGVVHPVCLYRSWRKCVCLIRSSRCRLIREEKRVLGLDGKILSPSSVPRIACLTTAEARVSQARRRSRASDWWREMSPCIFFLSWNHVNDD